jgi:hypothetical protein
MVDDSAVVSRQIGAHAFGERVGHSTYSRVHKGVSMSGYVLVAVKRRWIPNILFLMFAPVIKYQPFRWLFTTPVSDE